VTTQELIDELRKADPGGHRQVEAQIGNRTPRRVLDVNEGVHSEVHPVILKLECHGSEFFAPLPFIG